MAIRAGQIFRLKVNFRKAEYARPCLVLRVTKTEADICFFSTKFELKKSGDLTIHAIDPSFSKTGLTEESYLVEESIHGEPLEIFNGAKLMGIVAGEIKVQIEKWWGSRLE